MTKVKHSSDDGISGDVWVEMPEIVSTAYFKGKLACICYGPDTPPAVTEAYVNAAIGYNGGWTQAYQWILGEGDGDPDVCIPDGVEPNDPRVIALCNVLYENDVNGIYPCEQIDNDDCMNICASTDDAVLLFVNENANGMFPEHAGLD